MACGVILPMCFSMLYEQLHGTRDKSSHEKQGSPVVQVWLVSASQCGIRFIPDVAYTTPMGRVLSAELLSG